MVFAGVLYSEEVPLAEALCSIIIFQIELVLEGAYFHGLPEVAALKSGLNLESLVDGEGFSGWIIYIWLFYFVVINSVIRLELLIVSVESWPCYPTSFLLYD